MGAHGESWVSDELLAMLNKLSPQQASGVLRIVQAELDGRTLSSLLDCRDQICTSSTYYGYGKRPGWRSRPEFTEALDMARRDYRGWLLENGTAEAMAILSRTAGPAAREVARQVTGDSEALDTLVKEFDKAVEAGKPERLVPLALALAATGLPGALPALQRALEREWENDVYSGITTAVARLAASLDSERQRAAFGILDRASARTASKSTVAESGTKTITFDLSGIPTDILRTLANARADS